MGGAGDRVRVAALELDDAGARLAVEREFVVGKVERADAAHGGADTAQRDSIRVAQLKHPS